eukprot:1305572-Rhodomonas_salina.4
MPRPDIASGSMMRYRGSSVSSTVLQCIAYAMCGVDRSGYAMPGTDLAYGQPLKGGCSRSRIPL